MERPAIGWIVVGLAVAAFAAFAASRNQQAVRDLVAPRAPASVAPIPSEFEVEWLAPSAAPSGH